MPPARSTPYLRPKDALTSPPSHSGSRRQQPSPRPLRRTPEFVSRFPPFRFARFRDGSAAAAADQPAELDPVRVADPEVPRTFAPPVFVWAFTCHRLIA